MIAKCAVLDGCGRNQHRHSERDWIERGDDEN